MAYLGITVAGSKGHAVDFAIYAEYSCSAERNCK